MPNNDLIEHRMRFLSRLALFGAIAVVLFIMAGTFFMLNLAFNMGQHAADLRAVAIETHTALCALNHDIETRLETLRAFLQTNPQGVAGIDRDTLLRSAENYESTLAALDVLNCE